jgi:outer membrane protein assembly factor BamB
MPRRLMSAWVGLLLVATIAQAQIPFSKDLMPARTSLARLGLERHWFNVIPLGGNAEKVSEVSIDEGLVFAQTDKANFFAYDAESGRLLWTANFGKFSVDAYPASANSTMIFVTNSNTLHALDRKTGREVWTVNFESIPAGSTSADEDYVWVGMNSGMLHTLRAKDGKELWNVQSRGALTSRPHPAGRVIAYASHDGRVYASRTNFSQPLWQWAAGGPVTAPLGAYGIRTLLVPSLDKSLYAVDLFTAETKWNFPTGAPVEQEPLVSGDDVFVINNQGSLSSINAMSGSLNWTISTLNGSLLGVTKTRVYLESMDGDLFIVDRGTGQVLFSPRDTHERAGLNLRDFKLGPTNRLNDRIYLASRSGMLVCLREAGAVKPVPLRDPNLKPFGYIPPEGYPDTPPIAPVSPAKATDDASAPAEEKPVPAPDTKKKGEDMPKEEAAPAGEPK